MLMKDKNVWPSTSTGSIICGLILTLLFPVDSFGNDTPTIRSQRVLIQEIERLSGTTLANTNLSLSGLGRQAKSDYREALNELKSSFIEPETPFGGPSTAPFESLTTMLEAFGSLVEEQEREDELDALSEQFENRFELVREENVRPGTQWFETFQRGLDRGESLLRHHRLVTNLTGLVLAERLSPSSHYRIRLYTLQFERLFPELLMETVGDQVEGKHATRIYLELFERVSDFASESTTEASAWSGFRSLVRGHGFILNRLQRLGHQSDYSRRLLGAIEDKFEIRTLSSTKSSREQTRYHTITSRSDR